MIIKIVFNSMKRLLFPFFLLSGCAVNSAITDPWSYAPTSSSTLWKGEVSSEKAIPSEGKTLTLAETIDIALKNNTSTKLTWAAARAAAAAYGQSQATLLPSVTGEINAEKVKVPNFSDGTVSGAKQTTFGPRASLSYTIFDFGSKRASSDSARFALYYAGWTHNRAIESVVATVTKDYYDLAYQKELLSVIEQSVQTAEKTVQMAQIGFDTGVKSRSDNLQATTVYLQQQGAALDQKTKVKQAFATLAFDMGVPASTHFEIELMPTEIEQPAAIANLDTLIQLAMQSRADIKALEASFKASEHSVTAAQRALLPKLEFNSSLGRTYFDKQLHSGTDYAAGLKLSMPFFTGFSYRNAIKIAQANRESAFIKLESAKQSAIKELTTSQFNASIATEQLDNAVQFYQAAQQQYIVAKKQYKAGVATILDLLSAQDSLAQAKAKKAQVTQNFYFSLTNLAYATGVLYTDPKEEN